MEAPPLNLQDLKDLLPTSWCQIPQHTVRGLVEFMPDGWQQKGDLHSIRQVVIMLGLIGVFSVRGPIATTTMQGIFV